MNSIQNKKIVLIGGAGFIGHHLALALKNAGALVDIIDSLQVNNLLSLAYRDYERENRDLYHEMLDQRFELLRRERIPIEVQDAREYHALSMLLNKIKPQIIIHLAAVAHAGESNKNPYSTFDHSLRTLENALDWARGQVEHFIYFSSSLVYGHFPKGFVTEQTPCDPLGIYGALKFSGEKFIIAYNQVFDLPFTIIRPSALYGERCISRRVAQIFIENALKKKPITVHGNGEDCLDFTYIQDLIQGVIKVITENEKSRNQIFNLTYGESRTMKELAQVVSKYFIGLDIKYIPKDHLTPDRGTLCVDKAKRLLGYTPQYPLEKGMEAYINWYKSTWEFDADSERILVPHG